MLHVTHEIIHVAWVCAVGSARSVSARAKALSMPKAKADAATSSEPAAKKAKGPGPTTSAKAAAAGAENIPRSETPRKPLPEGATGLVLVHWNVAGLNALLKSDEKKARLMALVDAESPDVLAISEHKISVDKKDAAATALLELLPGYNAHWAVCTVKNGYSGIVALVRKGVNVSNVSIDTVGSLNEGRTVTLELDACHAVAAYVPNSGQDLGRLDYRIGTWEPAMRAHLKALEESGKPALLFGDLSARGPRPPHPPQSQCRAKKGSAWCTADAPHLPLGGVPMCVFACVCQMWLTSTLTYGTSPPSTSPSPRARRRASVPPSVNCWRLASSTASASCTPTPQDASRTGRHDPATSC